MAGKHDSSDPFGKIRHPKKRAFLAAMANTANVVRAAEIVRMDSDNHYLWLQKDPDYAAAFEIARMRGVDVLEAEAVRRAHEGVSKPIFPGVNAHDLQSRNRLSHKTAPGAQRRAW